MPLWDTNKLCNYGYVYKHYAVFEIVDIHDAKEQQGYQSIHEV